MENELTTYQIYLMLLGYVNERNDNTHNTQMLINLLNELYRRAVKAEIFDTMEVEE